MEGEYYQWLVGKSGRKESLEDKILDRVDQLSITLSSTTKSIIKLKTSVAAAKKAADQVERKVSVLKKLSSGDTRVKGGCAPD